MRTCKRCKTNEAEKRWGLRGCYRINRYKLAIENIT